MFEQWFNREAGQAAFPHVIFQIQQELAPLKRQSHDQQSKKQPITKPNTKPHGVLCQMSWIMGDG